MKTSKAISDGLGLNANDILSLLHEGREKLKNRMGSLGTSNKMKKVVQWCPNVSSRSKIFECTLKERRSLKHDWVWIGYV
jgi:hypothetical protein